MDALIWWLVVLALGGLLGWSLVSGWELRKAREKLRARVTALRYTWQAAEDELESADRTVESLRAYVRKLQRQADALRFEVKRLEAREQELQGQVDVLSEPRE